MNTDRFDAAYAAGGTDGAQHKRFIKSFGEGLDVIVEQAEQCLEMLATRAEADPARFYVRGVQVTWQELLNPKFGVAWHESYMCGSVFRMVRKLAGDKLVVELCGGIHNLTIVLTVKS